MGKDWIAGGLLAAAMAVGGCTPEGRETKVEAPPPVQEAGVPVDTAGLSGPATDTLGTAAGAPPGGPGSASSGHAGDTAASRAETGEPEPRTP